MMRKYFKLTIALATIGGPLIVVLGFLNAAHPAFDLIANFRYHAALGCIALALVWMSAKHWRIGLSVLLIGVYALNGSVSGLPNFSKKTESTIEAADRIYSLLAFNVRFDNPNRNDLLDLIEQQDPDIFIGTEISSNWSDQIFRLKETYKNVFHCPEWQNRGGLFIFSKLPFVDAKNYCHTYAAYGTQTIIIEGQPITIGGVHLRWPWPGSQPEQLKALNPVLEKLEEDALVAGDFNAATWSYAVSSFAEAGGLQVVPHIGLTWLDKRLPKFLRRLVGLPIDNVMHKGSVNILEAKALAHAGSDHLPVLVRFSIGK